ncbi:DoxX family protein [Sphaerisporangium sp. NPDC051011]|uniref:DoxX family protein n=1 Tax=Sphaerisporangium sp. NPDC051011 TaxID=3155792 RepID=UPI0033D5A021
MMEKAYQIALLVARVIVGIIFIVHGVEKFTSIDATTAFFQSSHVPLPRVSTLVAAAVELVGGVALVLGLLLPLFGTLLALDMLFAIIFVHASKGFWVSKDGYEYVLTLLAVSIALAYSRGGFLAADSLWRRGRKAQE